jgi:hypothetical protein
MSPSVIDRQHLREQLQPDGSLRDIYVHDADEQLWQRFLVALPRSPYRWRFKHGKRSIPEPLGHFDEAAKLRETDPVLLQIDLSPTLTLNCHFFTAEEIELDLAPPELQSDDAVGMLIDFMKWLACAVIRPVVLTHENQPAEIILRVEHTGT